MLLLNNQIFDYSVIVSQKSDNTSERLGRKNKQFADNEVVRSVDRKTDVSVGFSVFVAAEIRVIRILERLAAKMLFVILESYQVFFQRTLVVENAQLLELFAGVKNGICVSGDASQTVKGNSDSERAVKICITEFFVI